MTRFSTFQVRSQPAAIRYVLALLAAFVVLLLRQVLSLWLGANYPYLTVSAAVVFSGWYCGVGPSIVTTLTTLLGTWYWFVPTVGSFALTNPGAQVVGMIVFLILSGFIIARGRKPPFQGKIGTKRVPVQEAHRIQHHPGSLHQYGQDYRSQ